MEGFPQHRSRVSLLSLVFVVLILSLLNNSLPLQAYAQEVQTDNEPQAETNRDGVDTNAYTNPHDPNRKNASAPSPAKKPTQKQPSGSSLNIVEGPSTIQWRASLLKGGCAQAVSDYLKRIHDDSKSVKNAVSQARKKVNFARLHKPQNVPSAEQRLNASKQALNAFDAETLRLFGASLPKTCVTEVKDRMGLPEESTSLNSAYDVALYIFRSVMAHTQTFYLTMKGVWNYTVDSYIPIVKDFQGFSDVYYKKAVKLFNEAHPRPGLLTKISGKPKTVPTSEFIVKILKGLAYACVPLALVAFIGLVVALLFPVLMIGVFIPDLIYHVWIRLFIFYYPYAMVFPSDFITEVQGLYVFAFERNWGACWGILKKAITGAMTNFDGLYYNTVLMGQMVWFVTFIFGVMMWNWMYFFIIRRKRTKTNSPYFENVKRDENILKLLEKSKKKKI
ncbi:unnamed protein product [Phytomonas sp. Hart1]|nr:unnamed protein product [Phytomonas sp. Hart1]|eukprot:CCW68282.1 unnamed protein product [Phytomonas sp. isolate Hart1]